MLVLGISPFHDSSVSVYSENGIEAFYKEERLTRVKRDLHPFKSLEKIKNDFPKIDYAVICSPTNTDQSLYTYNSYIKKIFNTDNVVDLSAYHHLQHASLAFYNSGFEKSLVVVIDRNGSIFSESFRESESVYIAEYPDKFTEIYKNFWHQNSSLGAAFKKDLLKYYKERGVYVTASSGQGIVKVYETATAAIGQHVLENGKTMGLSSYGEKTEKFPKLFEELGVGSDEHFYHENDKWDNYSCRSVHLNGLQTNNITSENYKIYADWAYHIQKETQGAALSIIKQAVSSTGIKNVCITGGYGLNVLANQFYIESMLDVNFYFEPLADDSGNSLGGAMIHYRHITKDKKIKPIKDTNFHGIKYDLNFVKGASCSAADIAKLLSLGKSVAIYNGVSEAGPRALGNRSILFDPRIDNAKDIVNLIKKREWYRPFAAAVLEEDADRYFDMSIKSSPYMTVSFNSNSYAKDNIPGVIHVDGTCRIQTVDKENVLYNLLKEFKKLTGHGVLLNTSFNLAGEPLVETPEEAINVLNNSNLDYIWFPEIERCLN